MFKKLFAVGAILVLVLAVLVGLAIFNANALSGTLKPKIEEQASSILGSNVTIAKVGLDLFPAIDLSATGVNVALEEGAEDGISLESLDIRLEFWPLLRRQVVLSSIILDELRLIFISDEEGVRVAGLPPSDDPTVVPDFELGSFRINDGVIIFRDIPGDTTYEIRNWDLDTAATASNNVLDLAKLRSSGVALEDTDFEVDAEALGLNLDSGAIQMANLDVESADSVIRLNGDLDSSDPAKKLKITSDKIDVGGVGYALKPLAPDLDEMELRGLATANLEASYPTEETLKVTGTAGLNGISAMVSGIEVVDARSTLSVTSDAAGQTVRTDDLAMQLTGIPVNGAFAAKVADEKATVSDVAVEAFGGTASGGATLSLAEDQRFTANVETSNVDIAEVVQALNPDGELKLTGSLASFKSNLSGAMGEEMLDSITGDASVSVTDGELKDVNLAALVLKAVTDLPFLPGALYDLVPKDKLDEFQRDYTVVKTLDGDFALADGGMTTDNLNLDSTHFELASAGRIGFDSKLDLKSKIYFTPEFSQTLVAQAKELDILLDDRGRLAFPLTISGTLPKVVVLPDLKGLVKQGARGILEKEVDKIIEKEGGDALKEGASNLLRDITGRTKKKDEDDETESP